MGKERGWGGGLQRGLLCLDLLCLEYGVSVYVHRVEIDGQGVRVATGCLSSLPWALRLGRCI